MTILYAIGSALAFAVIFLFRKQAARTLPLSVSVGIEALVAFFILLIVSGVMVYRDGKMPPVSKENIGFAVLAGVGFAIGVVLNVAALRSGTLSRVVSITSPAQIMFGILIGAIVLHERLAPLHIAGIAFCIIGIFLLTR